MRLPVALLLGISLSAPGLASAEGSHVALDIYAFGQRDPGPGREQFGVPIRSGNPYRAEGFDYVATSLDFRIQFDDEWALRGNAAGGWIIDEGVHPIPKTIRNIDVTSASPDLLTLDSQASLEWTSSDGSWRVAPGLFYHHQKSYFVGGPNLEVARTLAGGDTVLFTNASFRLALIQGPAWDGFSRGRDFQTTLNVLVGWTQNWSRAFVSTLSAQYAWQTGRLHNAWNYVVVHDPGGTPVQLVDERLPGSRHRGQLNLRGRWSPAPRWSLGLDLSGYYDTWDVIHGSAQPNLELPLGDARLRLWYRLSRQRATRYFVSTAGPDLTYVTQDSDLGSFWSHSPGLLATVPLGKASGFEWEGRASAYGFARTDRVFAVGGQLGITAAW